MKRTLSFLKLFACHIATVTFYALVMVFTVDAQTNVVWPDSLGILHSTPFVPCSSVNTPCPTNPVSTNPPPPIIASSGATNETFGPFASWDDVRKAYGALGDGATDDTLAISNAYANAGLNGHSPVLYGGGATYRVSQTISFIMRDGVRRVGLNFKWFGSSSPASSAMFVEDRVPRCSYEQCSFDGNGANLILVNQSCSQGNLFNTADQYLDCTFTNAAAGLALGIWGQNGDSEVSVVRSKFFKLGIGIRTGNFNALDEWIHDSEFGFCAIGVSDTNGAGGFHCYQDFFHDCSNDVYVINTSFFAVRDCLSSNDYKFFLADGGPSSPTTLQRNTVINPRSQPCVSDGNTGPLYALDNTIISPLPGPFIKNTSAQADVISIGNTYPSANAESFTGRTISVSNVIASATPAPFALSPPAVNFHRQTIDLPAGASASQINAALASISNGVVHLSWGTNLVNATITIPPGSGNQLVGDGNYTVLVPASGFNGPMISASLGQAVRLLKIEDGGRQTTGVVVNVSNGSLWSRGVLLQDAEDAAGSAWSVSASPASIDMLDFQFGSMFTGAQITSPKAVIRLRGVATANSAVLFNLVNPNLQVNDLWYESNIAADFVHATGTGIFTINSFNGAVNVGSGPDGQTAIFSNWNGLATIANGSIRDRIIPQSGNGSLLVSGIEFDNLAGNPLTAVTSGLALWLYDNCRSVTNNALTQLPNMATGFDTNLFLSMMSPVRTMKAQENPPAGALILDRVTIDKSKTSLLVK